VSPDEGADRWVLESAIEEFYEPSQGCEAEVFVALTSLLRLRLLELGCADNAYALSAHES